MCSHSSSARSFTYARVGAASVCVCVYVYVCGSRRLATGATVRPSIQILQHALRITNIIYTDFAIGHCSVHADKRMRDVPYGTTAHSQNASTIIINIYRYVHKKQHTLTIAHNNRVVYVRHFRNTHTRARVFIAPSIDATPRSMFAQREHVGLLLLLFVDNSTHKHKKHFLRDAGESR